jgi:hypothetical protein
MGFRVLPVLETVREIYAIPRGRPRFDAYVARMCDAEGNLRLPLTGVRQALDAPVPCDASTASAPFVVGFTPSEADGAKLVITEPVAHRASPMLPPIAARRRKA